MSTRRKFLAQLSCGVTGAAVWGNTRPLSAQPEGHIPLPVDARTSPLPPAAWLPEPISATALRTRAHACVDAAHTAGAHYADVRVAYVQSVFIDLRGTTVASPDSLRVSSQYMYGVRARVEKGWAFVHGCSPSLDAITSSAVNAVSAARGFAAMHENLGDRSADPWDEVMTLPSTAETWETPCHVDPFAIPIADQCALLAAYVAAATRVRNGTTNESSFDWERETRVFASTHNASLVQTFHRALPQVVVGAGFYTPSLPEVKIPIFEASLGGYERVNIPGGQDQITERTEEAVRLLGLPQRTLDIGRYPVVLDGASVARVFALTLGRALESDRALGHEIGGSGLGYLSPAENVRGTLIASPLLTVSAHRKLPSVTAAQWDDDGVPVHEFPLVDNGRLANYVTSCQTTADFRSRVSPGAGIATPTGCAVASPADAPVMVRVPHLVGRASANRASLEDLCTALNHGVLLRYARYVAVDSTLGSGIFHPSTTMLEIRKGRIAGFVKGNGIQFSTPRFWKSLDVLGDASTVNEVTFERGKGLPESFAWHAATMPAARFKEADCVNTSVRITQQA